MESRLAALTVDTDDLSKLSAVSSIPGLPSTLQPPQLRQLATLLPPLFNMLNVRRAIIPAANGHVSARALARYYAALADGGKIPPPHSAASKPPLGSHPHIPKFSCHKSSKKQKSSSRRKRTAIPFFNRTTNPDYQELENIEARNTSSSENDDDDEGSTSNTLGNQYSDKIFENPRILDEFLGRGEYENLVLANGSYGLGFKRFSSEESSMVFGHSGMGGSTGFCDAKNRFAITVTLNKMSLGGVTAKIVQLVCSELNIGMPDEFLRLAVEHREVDTPLVN